jgi:zinc and cadmium transporter
MNALSWIALGGILMSLIALVGSVTTLLRPATLERLLLPLVSIAAGSLLGGALFHMIPVGLEALPVLAAAAWIAAGFCLFLGLEQFLHWHHCRHAFADCRKPQTYLILLGDGIHNFLGGLGVASVFLADPRAGITAWLAAAAHEIPQELGDFGVLVHGGWQRTRALVWNFLSGLTFLLGALIAYVAARSIDTSILALVGAGNFIYIATSDLIPEIKTHTSLRGSSVQFICFVSALALMFLLAYLFE